MSKYRLLISFNTTLNTSRCIKDSNITNIFMSKFLLENSIKCSFGHQFGKK